MKKWIAMILVMCMALTMAACGSDKPQESNPPKQTEQAVSSNTQQENEALQQTQPVDEEWGVECCYAIFNGARYVDVYASFPDRKGKNEGTGMIAVQFDGTTAVLDSWTDGVSPEVASLDELFPACSEQLMRMFRQDIGVGYENNSIQVERVGNEAIGSYEVVKFHGVHTYTEDGSEKNCQFVIYATALIDGGNYIYVMVQDNTSDQSQLELIESHAYNMIRSMREE